MLDAIEVFLAVVEAGSLSRVARASGVAVSSIARKLDALERELGVKLVQRSPRLIFLTDAGAQFVPRARAILSELDDARHELSASNADPRGQLVVAAPSSFGRRHVAPAVASFLKQYPLIDMVLHLSDQVLDLRAERMDVAIRVGALPDSELVATQLAPFERIACASPDYLAAHGRPAAPADLLEHNCITLASMPVPLSWWSFDGVNGGAPLAVKGNFRTDDTEAMLTAAMAGVGVSHLASWLVSDAIVAGRLVALFPVARSTTAKRAAAIHAVRLPGRSHAAKAQLFIAHLRAVFGAPPYWDAALALRS